MNERILPFKTFKNTEYILYYIHLKYFFRIKNKKLCIHLYFAKFTYESKNVALILKELR